jgi:hypothetical protein
MEIIAAGIYQDLQKARDALKMRKRSHGNKGDEEVRGGLLMR